MDKISIIVPCFNEEEALPLFYRRTAEVAGRIEGTETEFIFVDDGSSDHTLEILETLARQDKRVKYLSFSRNFGKEAAMYAGLSHASGDYCAILDADLQDPPELLGPMYHTVTQEGYDCCGARRTDRKGEGGLRSTLSSGFYKMMGKICKLNLSDGERDFRMMSRKMVDAVLEVKEYNRYLKGIFSFVGFDTKWIEFPNAERAAGTSKWNIRSLFTYAMEGVFSFSSAPASLATAGSVLSFCAAAAVAAGSILYRITAGSWGSSLLPVILLILVLNGIQMMVLGILGQYLSRDYLESKNRPLYIIRSQAGFE